MSGMSIVAAAIILAVTIMEAHPQPLNPYGYGPYVPYGGPGGGSPMYRRDWTDYYTGNGARWYTAPRARPGPGPYPEYLGRPYPRSFEPSGDWRGRRY